MRDANSESYNYYDFLDLLEDNPDIIVSIDLDGQLYTNAEIVADSVQISGDLFSNNDISIGGTCSREIQFSVIPKDIHRFSVVKNIPAGADPYLLGWYERIQAGGGQYTFFRTLDRTVNASHTYCEETGNVFKKAVKAIVHLEVTVLKIINGVTTPVTARIPKGTYYVKLDSRDGITGIYTFKGNDALGRLNKRYITNEETTGWPKPITIVIQEICDRFDIPVDPRTSLFFEEEVAPLQISIPYPGFGDNAYTCRDMLSFMAVMLAGNWVINDEGALQFIKLVPDTIVSVQDLQSNVASLDLKRLSDRIGGVQVDLMQEDSDSNEELYCEYVPYEPCGSTETVVDPEVLYFEQTDGSYKQVELEPNDSRSPVAEGWLYDANDIPYVELVRGYKVIYEVAATAGETISLSYSQQGPRTVKIDWGDNTPLSTSDNCGGGVEITASHAYNSTAHFYITVASDQNGNWWNVIERPQHLVYQAGKHAALETEVISGRTYYEIAAYKRVTAGANERWKGVSPVDNRWYELYAAPNEAPQFILTTDDAIQMLPRQIEYIPVDLYDTNTWGDTLSPSTDIDNINPYNADWYEYDPRSQGEYARSNDQSIEYVYYSDFIPGKMVRYVIDVSNISLPVVVKYRQSAANLVIVQWVAIPDNESATTSEIDTERGSQSIEEYTEECAVSINFATVGKKVITLSMNPTISGQWWVTQRPSVEITSGDTTTITSVCRKYPQKQYYAKKDVTKQEYKFYYRRVLPEYQLIDPASYDYENQNPFQNNWYRRKYGDKMLTAACPWMSTELLKRVFENVIRGFTYQAYDAEDAMIYPLVELGDYITIADKILLFAHFDTTLGLIYSATISAPIEDADVEAGDATLSLSERILSKKLSDMSSALRVSDDGISLMHTTTNERGEVVSAIDILDDGIELSVTTEPASGSEGNNLRLILRVNGKTIANSTVTITGNLDVSGELSAEALYAALGDIADLTVNSLTTSRRIPLYLTKSTDDDNFIRAKDENYEWVSGTVRKQNNTPIRVQLIDPSGRYVYWDYTDGGSQYDRDIRDLADISGSDVYIDSTNGFPYLVGGGRIFTTTEQTMFPVYVYDYTELVKARLGFETSDDGRGNIVYIPVLKLGAGDTSQPPNNYATISKPEDGLKINYRVPKTASFNPGKEIGIKLGRDGFVDVYGERRPTDIDCRQWPDPGNTGSMTVQMQGESTPRTYSVVVNSAGTKITVIEASSGHSCTIKMPGYTEA